MYNGVAHGISVNVTPSENIEIYYATTELTENNYNTEGSTTPITQTDAGTTTVYYYVHDTSGNYKDYASNENSNNGTITITKVTLTPSATANSKEYDGTTNTRGTITLTGAVNNENPIATATFAFDTKHVETGKTVTVSNISLGSKWATNYELSTTDLTLNNGVIIAKTVTPVVVADSKTYDGTTNATGLISLTGVISGDDLTATATSYKFENETAGTNKTVTASGITISGNDSGNYILGTTQTGTADINKAILTVIATAQNKTYDGTTDAKGEIKLSGGVIGENPTGTATFTFENPNVGTGRTVNVTNIALDSTWVTNYELAETTTTTTADITAVQLVATYVSEEILVGETPVLKVNVTGFVNGETTSNAAGYKHPTVINSNTAIGTYTLTPQGGEATNYSFKYVSGTLTIKIDTIKVTVSPETFTYTGNACEPEVTVIVDGTTLEQGTDYTVEYTDNINAGTASAKVTLIGNYSGTASKNFTIEKAEGEASVEMDDWVYGDDEEYVKSPEPTSSTNGTTNVKYEYYTDADCTIKTTSAEGASETGAKPSNSGTYYVKAIFPETDNYNSVEATTSFEIKKAVLTATATTNSKAYDGKTTGSGTIIISGGKNNEAPTATATFTFEDPNVGTGKTVNVTEISLDEIWTANYELEPTSLTLTDGII